MRVFTQCAPLDQLWTFRKVDTFYAIASVPTQPLHLPETGSPDSQSSAAQQSPTAIAHSASYLTTCDHPARRSDTSRQPNYHAVSVTSIRDVTAHRHHNLARAIVTPRIPYDRRYHSTKKKSLRVPLTQSRRPVTTRPNEPRQIEQVTSHILAHAIIFRSPRFTVRQQKTTASFDASRSNKHSLKLAYAIKTTTTRVARSTICDLIMRLSHPRRKDVDTAQSPRNHYLAHSLRLNPL